MGERNTVNFKLLISRKINNTCPQGICESHSRAWWRPGKSRKVDRSGPAAEATSLAAGRPAGKVPGDPARDLGMLGLKVAAPERCASGEGEVSQKIGVPSRGSWWRDRQGKRNSPGAARPRSTLKSKQRTSSPTRTAATRNRVLLGGQRELLTRQLVNHHSCHLYWGNE